MRKSFVVLALALTAVGVAGVATAQRFDRGGFSFRFDRNDPRRAVEGKRATCEVYARIASVQADAAARFRCGYQGPAWISDMKPHFVWCRFVPRRRIAEEQRHRAEELQKCFDKLGDFDDDRYDRR